MAIQYNNNLQRGPKTTPLNTVSQKILNILQGSVATF